jgi:predicted glycosyltransferase
VSCVGYYVHHVGVGHERRFRAIAAAADDIDVVPISELPFDGGVLLPSDVPDVPPDDPTAGGQLHWAPLHATTATRRLKTIVDWLESAKPSGVVVDVSVEMVLACRLAGVRTIAVRQHGDRTDAAHRLAFGSAVRLLAPFPAEFETSTDPVTVGKTDHVGFIQPLGLTADASPSPVTAEDVVVLWGRGGGHIPGRRLDAIASVVPGRVFCVGVDIWAANDAPRSEKVVELGWVEDPRGLLLANPLVVGSCGNNSVALVASSECPFVALPQERPFDEQVQLAEALEAVGVAAVAPECDDPPAWRDVIARAECRSKRWARLDAPIDGATAAADVIRRWLT